MGKRIWSVGFELRRLDVIHLGNFLLRYFTGDRGDVRARYSSLKRPSSFGSNRLPGCDGFPRDAIQLAFALFDNYENSFSHKISSQITRNSFFNFSTNFLATSPGEPSRNSVFFDFSGMYILSIFCRLLPIADCTSASATLRIGFVLACLIPISVA